MKYGFQMYWFASKKKKNLNDANVLVGVGEEGSSDVSGAQEK